MHTAIWRLYIVTIVIERAPYQLHTIETLSTVPLGVASRLRSGEARHRHLRLWRPRLRPPRRLPLPQWHQRGFPCRRGRRDASPRGRRPRPHQPCQHETSTDGLGPATGRGQHIWAGERETRPPEGIPHAQHLQTTSNVSRPSLYKNVLYSKWHGINHDHGLTIHSGIIYVILYCGGMLDA